MPYPARRGRPGPIQRDDQLAGLQRLPTDARRALPLAGLPRPAHRRAPAGHRAPLALRREQSRGQPGPVQHARVRRPRLAVRAPGAAHRGRLRRAGPHVRGRPRDRLPADVHTITYPGETSTTVAPAPITTADPERLPAWSPDGLQLGFVGTVTGCRKLGVYDLTPGLQTIVNPLVDLGPDAPTPQTRQFQSVYGGLSLAAIPAAPAVGCTQNCIKGIQRAQLTLAPTVSRVLSGQRIGIFVVRRTGATRTVLGVKQPRIKVVGRVSLGATKRDTNRFRWDGRVGGKRLKPGEFLLTYRLLRGERVTTVSDSVPFTVR